MTRATAVVITSSPTFGSECQGPFREVALFPVVVGNVDRAVSLLRQFQIDVVVLESSDASSVDDQQRRMAKAAGDAPLLVFVKLPSPSQLAAAVREALERPAGERDSAHVVIRSVMVEERTMLRSIRTLQGFQIVARDGAIGSVDQFYFDDERWAIRYLVVDTGKWLPGRRVLISPFSIREVNWIADTVSLSITREMVKSSPDIHAHKPISRQHEASYLRYYGYPYYWGGAGLWGPGPYPAGLAAESMAEAHARVEAEQDEARARGDTHLRSSKEVLGYHLQATDGELGHVEDFLVEEESWAIRYIVVDTSNWWFGRKVVIPPDWAREVSWTHNKVFVDLTREVVKQAPEYDAAAHLDRQWEAAYYAHYRRAPYWENAVPGARHVGRS